jgi:hypothetical protein
VAVEATNKPDIVALASRVTCRPHVDFLYTQQSPMLCSELDALIRLRTIVNHRVWNITRNLGNERINYEAIRISPLLFYILRSGKIRRIDSMLEIFQQQIRIF